MRTLKFNNSAEWEQAMDTAVEIVGSIQGIASFPWVSITSDWIRWRVEIEVPHPLYASVMDRLQEVCQLHNCEYVLMTNVPDKGPYIDIQMNETNR